MARSIYSASLNASNTIIVNGKTMSLREYKRIQREKKASVNNTACKKRKSETNEIKLLPMDVNTLLKGVKVFRSLVAFYTNGKKTFGKIFERLMNINDIGTQFGCFKLIAVEINDIVRDIETIARNREKASYSYVEKLSYKMDDAHDRLLKLYNAVNDSNILNSPMQDHKIICGEGKILGLRILMKRTLEATYQIDGIISKLKKLSSIPDDVNNNAKIMKYGCA